MTLDEFAAAVRALQESRALATSERSAPLSVSEQVAQAVKRLIMRGDLAPGARVLETDLAERFGVSRAPVREALRILHKEGFIELTPRRGAQVYLPSAADVSDLYEIRAEIFALAARKAAVAMDAQLLALAQHGVTLIAGLAREAEVSPLDFLQVRTGLSTLILVAANNARLSELIGVLGSQAMTHARAFESADHRQRNAEGWVRLFDAIASRDGERAGAEARKLVWGSRDELLSRMRADADARRA